MKRWSINKTLNDLFIYAASALAVIFCFYYFMQRTIVADSYDSLNTDFTKNISSYMAQRLDGYVDELRYISDKISIDTSIEEIIASEPEQYFKNAFQMLSDSATLVLANMSGKYYYAPEILIEDLKPKLNTMLCPWYIQSSQYRLQPLFSLPYTDLITGHKRLSLSMPLFDSVAMQKGVIATSIRVEVLNDFLQKIQGPVNGRLLVISKDGTVIATSSTREKSHIVEMLGESGKYENAKYINYYEALHYPDWYVVYEVLKDDLNFLVSEESIIVIYSSVFAILILLFCWNMMHRRAKDIEYRLSERIIHGKIIRENLSLPTALSSIDERRSILSRQSILDGLTGLYNRRKFDQQISQIHKNEKVLLALLDIDNFKSINDKCGHPIGDEVLIGIASLAKEDTNNGNISLYRYGGEEIAIIFRNMDILEAFNYLEALRITIEKYSWSIDKLKVTFSAGLVECTGGTLKASISTADKFLYEAKRTGKNKIVYQYDSHTK